MLYTNSEISELSKTLSLHLLPHTIEDCDGYGYSGVHGNGDSNSYSYHWYGYGEYYKDGRGYGAGDEYGAGYGDGDGSGDGCYNQNDYMNGSNYSACGTLILFEHGF